MPAYHPLILAGVELWLLAEKAIYWPARQALLVADIHFGKAAAFRALGQPVPHGTTAGNIARLDSLLARYDCREIIFLGDFLHAPESRAPLTLDTLERWRRALAVGAGAPAAPVVRVARMVLRARVAPVAPVAPAARTARTAPTVPAGTKAPPAPALPGRAAATTRAC